MDFSSAVMSDLHKYVSPKNKKPSPMISKETYDIITEHADVCVCVCVCVCRTVLLAVDDYMLCLSHRL